MATLTIRKPGDLMEFSLKLDPFVRDWLEEGYCISPAVESYRKSGAYVVRVDLPGVDPRDVQLTFEGNHLTIEGERKREEPDEELLLREEVCYGPFRRTLYIPGEIKGDEVKANYREGVLEIRAPLGRTYEEGLPQRIKVEEING
jgi:HSP20 family molecular chaperone IbpA